MSFEYYGSFTALNFLRQEADAGRDQAEAVAEAIIRHADIGETGNLTSLCQLVQLTTLFGKSIFCCLPRLTNVFLNLLGP
jgi:cyanamide hydratase